MKDLYIPPNAKLFMADADSMHTNISTPMGLNLQPLYIPS
jgi:hypothetical protein